MKVLVPVKRVVDKDIKVRVKSDGSGVDIANVKMSMNPFDEIAVEEAVRLKEKGVATEVRDRINLAVGEPAEGTGPAQFADIVQPALAYPVRTADVAQAETKLRDGGATHLLSKDLLTQPRLWQSRLREILEEGEPRRVR